MNHCINRPNSESVATHNVRLNDRRARFVQHYLLTLNAAQSAISAGYSVRSAKQVGSKILTNVDVAAAIHAARIRAHEVNEVSNERLVAELARVAFFDIGSIYDDQGRLLPIKKISAEGRKALASVESTETVSDGAVVGRSYKVKPLDKLRAIELLMRHRGMLNDRVTLAGDLQNPLALLVQQVQGHTISPARRCKN